MSFEKVDDTDDIGADNADDADDGRRTIVYPISSTRASGSDELKTGKEDV